MSAKRREKFLPLKIEQRGDDEGFPIGCNECSNDSARIVDGMLIWQSKHNGRTHLNGISIESLERAIKLSRERE